MYSAKLRSGDRACGRILRMGLLPTHVVQELDIDEHTYPTLLMS